MTTSNQEQNENENKKISNQNQTPNEMTNNENTQKEISPIKRAILITLNNIITNTGFLLPKGSEITIIKTLINPITKLKEHIIRIDNGTGINNLCPTDIITENTLYQAINPIITPCVDKNNAKNKPIEENKINPIITPCVDKCPICNNPINDSKESINHNGNLYLPVCSKKCRDMLYITYKRSKSEVETMLNSNTNPSKMGSIGAITPKTRVIGLNNQNITQIENETNNREQIIISNLNAYNQEELRLIIRETIKYIMSCK